MASAGHTFYNVIIGSEGTTNNFTINGSNTFNNLTSYRSAAFTLYFANSSTQTFAKFSVNGSSGNVVTVRSATTLAHTLIKTGPGLVTVNYLNISYSTATPANTWFAGQNSTNTTGNSGWSFASRLSIGSGITINPGVTFN